MVELLNELTRILPDDTWLSMLEVSGSKLRVQGESGSASSLIGLIEESDLFHDPGFASPITRNRRTGLDRFVLEAEIETTGDSG